MPTGLGVQSADGGWQMAGMHSWGARWMEGFHTSYFLLPTSSFILLNRGTGSAEGRGCMEAEEMADRQAWGFFNPIGAVLDARGR